MTDKKYIYVVHCLDDQSCGMVDKGARFGGSELRMSVYDQHKAYMAETSNPESPNYIKKLGAGPMESECGKYMIGSMFILEATREEVDNFHQNDPFYAAKVWNHVSITRWISIPNGLKPFHVEMDGDDRSTIRMVTDDK